MKKKIRHIGASAIAYLFIALGLTRSLKKKALKGDFILSIYFHAPSKKLFEFCITWLKKNKFQFLSQEDILLIANKSKPFPKGGVVITVDDGWQTNEENIVAVANKYKVPVTIFVSSDPVEKGNFWWSYIDVANRMELIGSSIESLKKVSNEERKKVLYSIKDDLQLDRQAMTVDQIKNISKSEHITIGGHTVSHPILINCNDEEAYIELKESKEKIEEWVNKNIKCFAYPNGDYNEREIKYLKETGYALAYTTQATYLTENCLQNIYEIPRFCIFENISKAEAVCRMLGLWQKYF